MTEHPTSEDTINRLEREAAYWREFAEETAGWLMNNAAAMTVHIARERAKSPPPSAQTPETDHN